MEFQGPSRATPTE